MFPSKMRTRTFFRQGAGSTSRAHVLPFSPPPPEIFRRSESLELVPQLEYTGMIWMKLTILSVLWYWEGGIWEMKTIVPKYLLEQPCWAFLLAFCSQTYFCACEFLFLSFILQSRWVKQETEISKESQETDNRPKLDLGFKEGQTIKLNIGVRVSSSWSAQCFLCWFYVFVSL